MIRRVFWLSVGAAAGITGYRRATAVGRAVSARVTGTVTGAGSREVAGPFWPPQPGQLSAPAQPSPAVQPSQAGHPAQPPYPGARLTPGRPAALALRAPSPARMAWLTSRAAWRTQKAAAARVRAANRFARDVREGMDMYMNRQDE